MYEWAWNVHVLIQLLTGHVRTMIESSFFFWTFLRSPVVQSCFQWESLKYMPNRNAWTFWELGIHAIFQEDRLHYHAVCHPGCLIASSMCHEKRANWKRKGFPGSLQKKTKSVATRSDAKLQTPPSHKNSVTSSQKPLLETTFLVKNCARMGWPRHGSCKSIVYKCPKVLK
jgi:hypothetical protein